ncbi:MAG: glycerate kinase [Deltaproteobacteria bacterium]|nr:glycerate kinase [Deltaproteobacteria bacterium]MBW2650356.1 glycerate kinase [Deltaproteobacteria bacterium]
MKNPRLDIREIFDAGLKAADPGEAIRRAVKLTGKRLVIGDREYDPGAFDRVVVVGAGKAAASMASALEGILGSYITEGMITTKYGYGLALNVVSVTEAGHPIPDESGVRGSERILGLLEGAGERDLVLCVISGGGSALLPMPVSGISLYDKQKTTQALLDCGADIHEINTIRKHISGIKGGRLAEAAFPATLVALILSDVTGDDLDVIASGPTVPDRSTFRGCMEIVDKYDLGEKLPLPVIAYLKSGVQGREPETPKPGDRVFDRTLALVTGSCALSVSSAKQKAVELGYNAIILSSCIEGETRDVAKVHAAIAKEIQKSGNPVSIPGGVISGGETTVTIRGDGLGGRNMEFVLAAAMEIDGLGGITLLSGGTDGTDGPTDAAGAIADGTTVQAARGRGYDAARYLRNNDSYHFFEATGDLLMTGPTMTNVMDLRIFLVT